MKNIDDLLVNNEIDNALRIKRLKLAIKEHKKQSDSKFPVEAFPPRCQEMILSYCRCFGAKPEHYGLAMLTVAGAALGNAAWVEERGKGHPPILYSVIVDVPNMGKTPTVETVLTPLKRIEMRYRAENAIQLREHKQLLESDGKAPALPLPKEMILNDFTLEAVYKTLNANPRGLIVQRDELRGWLSSMNKYRAGSDETFWMENWNGTSAKISRINQGVRSLYLDKPFCSVIGTIQPVILKQFASGTKANDGFLARMLFSFPDVSIKPNHNTIKPDQEQLRRWCAIVEKIHNLPCEQEEPTDEFEDWRLKPHRIPLGQNAARIYIKFYNENAAKINKSEDEVEQHMLGKFDSYVLRLALIVEMLHWAENGPDDPNLEDLKAIKISGDSMKKAVELCEYFQYTALKVVNRLTSPVNELSPEQREWYKELPEEVVRKDALDLAKQVGISSATVGRLFNNPTLFKRVRQGVYWKNYV